MSKKYTFREITEKNELEKSFRLRYQVYSNCQCKTLIKTNGIPIDIDYYDFHSRHYSLIYNNTFVGYFRTVMHREEFTQNFVNEISNKYKIFNDFDYQDYKQSDTPPFPFLSYKEVPQGYWEYYQNLRSNNEMLVEASRLVLLPKFRNIRTSKFLIECAIVLYLLICFGKRQALISCNIKHRSFYEHYGFKSLGQKNGFTNDGFDSLAMTMSQLPDKYHSRFQDMADEFTLQQKIERTF